MSDAIRPSASALQHDLDAALVRATEAERRAERLQIERDDLHLGVRQALTERDESQRQRRQAEAERDEVKERLATTVRQRDEANRDLDNEAMTREQVVRDFAAARAEVDDWRDTAQKVMDLFDPLKPGASSAALRMVALGAKRANQTLRGRVSTLTEALAGMRGERDAEREIAQGWEQKAEALTEAREEAVRSLALANEQADTLLGQRTDLERALAAARAEVANLASERDAAVRREAEMIRMAVEESERRATAEARVSTLTEALRDVRAHVFAKLPEEQDPPRNRLQVIACRVDEGLRLALASPSGPREGPGTAVTRPE